MPREPAHTRPDDEAARGRPGHVHAAALALWPQGAARAARAGRAVPRARADAVCEVREGVGVTQNLPGPMVGDRGTKTALYRHFDAAGALLYVGISLHSIERTMAHRVGAHWYRSIARIEIQWLPSRADAMRAEREAITNERPLHNIVRPGCARREAKVEPSRAAFAVRHVRTGRLNGWWFRKSEADRLLGWFQAVFPSERFDLHAPQSEALPSIGQGAYLDTISSDLWSGAAPDYEAGDRHEARAAG